MMSGILSWVKQMIFLLIFLGMAQQLLPDIRYRKYLRFFCGLIFLITLMKPVFTVLETGDWEEMFYAQIDDSESKWTADSERERVQEELAEMEEMQSSLYQEYQERLTEDLTE